MPGILVQLEGAWLGAGKGACGIEQGTAPHHFTAGLEKQRHQAWVEVVVDYQGGDRRQGDDVAVWCVAGQIEQAFADLHLIEERQARLVGGCATKVCQGDVRVGRQVLHQWVFCRADEECCIQFAGHQRAGSFATPDALPAFGILFRLDGIGAENGVTGGAGAAAFAAQTETQRQQVGNSIQLHVTSKEQPQRFLIDRPQAFQLTLLLGCQLALQAALHQGDLHVGIIGQQLLQVVTRAGGGHQLQVETFLGQLFLELLGELLVSAALAAGGHAGTHRRRWWDELEQGPDQSSHHGDDPQVGQDHDFQVVQYAAHWASFLRCRFKDRTPERRWSRLGCDAARVTPFSTSRWREGAGCVIPVIAGCTSGATAYVGRTRLGHPASFYLLYPYSHREAVRRHYLVAGINGGLFAALLSPPYGLVSGSPT